LICRNCGLGLQGGDDAAVFVCLNCGTAHEVLEKGLVAFSPLTAAITTELAVAGVTHYLAVWRMAVTVTAAADSAWERIRKATAPWPAYLYVPAFSLMRAVMQRLGVSLTEVQPALELDRGLLGSGDRRPTLTEVGAGGGAGGAGRAGGGAGDDRSGGDGALGAAVAPGPDFGTYSPVVVGRQDARTLGHFVYLAVESHEAREVRSVDYRLETLGEELLFIPAVWDPRYIHESNWRLLLREFDGLVA